MIFAAIDFLQYLTKRGRYGASQKDGGMQIAFFDHVPDEIIEQMNEGDMIFTQRLDSLLSWAMMYFTTSPIDHVAVYAGNGTILHATLSGTKLHSLRSLTKGARVLIARMGLERLEWMRITNEQVERVDKGSSFSHFLPPKIQLLLSGLKIVIGKYPDRIYLRIFLDMFLALALFYALIFFIFEMHIGIIPLFLYLSALGYNMIKHTLCKRRDESTQIISHPDNAYKAFFTAGGLLFTKLGPIVVCESGILPLKVVLCFAGKSANDRADDKLKITSQFFCDLIESWNLHPKTKKSKENNTEQH